MKKIITLLAGVCLSTSIHASVSESDVINHYADLAHAMYEDSLISARKLHQSAKALIKTPSEANLDATKAAWKEARAPYQQTEAYRFGNAIVDDWEGKVNAWPLDEGLIDYVSGAYGSESDENPYYTANIIANKKLKLSGREINASFINKQLLSETLHEFDEIESNVATGYHAVEFLLWGQDLNGTKAGAGKRPATDFNTNKCTNGNCDRRAAYLLALTDLLIDELEWMTAQWNESGEARKTLISGSADKAIATIFTGMGSLAYGELAGERIKLGLMLHDPEEEHDCFSDNTHWSHFYDAKSIQNVYTGSYTRIDGSTINGPSVSDLVAAKDSDVDKDIKKRMDTMMAKMQVLVDSAEKENIAYDQLLAEGNEQGGKKIMAVVDSLLETTKGIEKGINVLRLESIAFEGSDSLDSPEKVE